MSHSVLARELMSHPVRRLTTHATVRDAAEFLLRHGISGAPAVDEHGQWQGVFTMNDIARYVASRVVRHHETQSLEARAPVTDSSRSRWACMCSSTRRRLSSGKPPLLLCSIENPA